MFIDTDQIEVARKRLTDARELLEKARTAGLREEYEDLFKKVLAARDAYNELRHNIITKLNLGIM